MRGGSEAAGEARRGGSGRPLRWPSACVGPVHSHAERHADVGWNVLQDRVEPFPKLSSCQKAT